MATKAERGRDARIGEFCERLVSHGFTGKERGTFYQYVKEVSGVKALVEVRRADKGNLFDNVYVSLRYLAESGSNEVRVHSSILRTADPSVWDADTVDVRLGQLAAWASRVGADLERIASGDFDSLSPGLPSGEIGGRQPKEEVKDGQAKVQEVR